MSLIIIIIYYCIEESILSIYCCMRMLGTSTP